MLHLALAGLRRLPVLLWVALLSACTAMPISMPGRAPADDPQWQQAYLDQYLAMEARGTPTGFKAGLTSRASQQLFGADRAIAGVLFERLDPDSTLSLAHFRKPMLEVELAFRLKQRVDTPVADIDALRALVAVVAPAVELPDLGAMSAEKPTAQEIVRANVAAHSYIVGQPMPVCPDFIDELNVRLWRNGELQNAASTKDLDGGVWQALLTLVNNRVRYGWIIEPEQWLLTGAMGGMRPLETGEYVADFRYGDAVLQKLQFTSGE